MSYFLKKGGGGWPGGMQGLGATAPTVSSTLGTPTYDCSGTPCDANGNPLPPAPVAPVPTSSPVVDTINSVFGWMMGGSQAPATSAGCARIATSVDGTTQECIDASGNVVGTINPTTGGVDAGFPWGSLALLGGLGFGAWYLLGRKK